VENIKRENEIKSKKKNGKTNKIISLSVGDPKEKCNSEFPVCINDMDKEFQRDVVSFVVLRLNKPNDFIIDNYFGGSVTKKFGNKTNTLDELNPDDVLIERRKHTCEIKLHTKTKSSQIIFISCHENFIEEELDLNYLKNSFRRRRKCIIIDIKILLILAVKVSRGSKKSVHKENKVDENEKNFELGKIYENIKKGKKFFYFR